MQFGVSVVVDWVALGFVCLGCDTRVYGDYAAAQYGVGDDVAGSQSCSVPKGFFPGRGGVDGLGHCIGGARDAVVSSSSLRCRATACMFALGVEEFAATVACGCLR